MTLGTDSQTRRRARAGRMAQGCAASVLGAALGAASPALHAKEEPLWEIGLGVGVLGYEDYRGAGSSHVYPVPVPYLVYNGPFLKADKDGLHGALFRQRWVELNLSFDATTPVSNDRTRSGLTDLRPTVEAGLSLDFHLWRSDDKRFKLDFKIPMREAFTLQAPPQAIGWTLTPGFDVAVLDPALGGWKLSSFIGPLFASKQYNDYFYSVPAQDASPGRPAYEASGGYAGTQFNWTISRRYPKRWVALYLRYDTLAGAVFEDSPLVRRQYYWTAGLFVSWVVGRSSRMVEVAD